MINAQDGDFFLRVNQISGSETFFEDIFTSTNIDFDQNDYCYIIALTPMSCPRCESMINIAIDKIYKEFNISPELLIVSSRNFAIKNYFEQSKFHLKNYLTIGDEIYTNLLLNTGTFLIPTILKFQKDGNLISYTPLFGDKIESNIDILFSDKNILKKVKKVKEKKEKIKYDSLLKFKSEVIYEDSIYYLDYVSDFFYDQGNIYIVDDQLNKIHKYKNGKIIDFYSLSQLSIESLSPTLNQNEIARAKSLGLIKPMFLSFFKTNKELYVTASFPKLIKSDESFQSFNDPQLCSLGKDGNTIECIGLVNIFNQNRNSPLYIDHTEMKYLDKKMLFPVEKGVPVIGSSLQDTVGGHDPFAESFYTETPLFAIFNEQGYFEKYIGSISEFSKKLKLGYSFTYPLFKIEKSKLYINDGVTNKWSIYDTEGNLTNEFFTKSYYSKLNKKPARNIDEIFKYDKIINYFNIDISFRGEFFYILKKYNKDGYLGSISNDQYFIEVYENSKYLKTLKLPNIYLNSICRKARLEGDRVFAIYQSSQESYFVHSKL